MKKEDLKAVWAMIHNKLRVMRDQVEAQFNHRASKKLREESILAVFDRRIEHYETLLYKKGE